MIIIPPFHTAHQLRGAVDGVVEVIDDLTDLQFALHKIADLGDCN